MINFFLFIMSVVIIRSDPACNGTPPHVPWPPMPPVQAPCQGTLLGMALKRASHVIRSRYQVTVLDIVTLSYEIL